MPELILIRGLPGSGKSTLASTLSASLTYWDGYEYVNYSHFETDMFFCLETGKYVFNPDQLHAAHKWCQDQVKGGLKAGSSVIVSNTFSRVWEMQPYLDMAKELGARVIVITCEGNYGNVHNVPAETIEKMRKRWEPYA